MRPSNIRKSEDFIRNFNQIGIFSKNIEFNWNCFLHFLMRPETLFQSQPARHFEFETSALNQWFSTFGSWRPIKQNNTQFGDPFITFIVLKHGFWRPKNGSGPTCWETLNHGVKQNIPFSTIRKWAFALYIVNKWGKFTSLTVYENWHIFWSFPMTLNISMYIDE